MTESSGQPTAPDHPSPRQHLIPPIVDIRPPVGSELPRSVYRWIVAFYGWVLLVAWLAYGRGTESDWNLSVALIICGMMLGIPAIIRHVSFHHQQERPGGFGDFLGSEFEVAGDHMTGREAVVQILVIPASLAILATAIALVFVAVGPVSA